jgi:hypothetical protein
MKSLDTINVDVAVPSADERRLVVAPNYRYFGTILRHLNSPRALVPTEKGAGGAMLWPRTSPKPKPDTGVEACTNSAVNPKER